MSSKTAQKKAPPVPGRAGGKLVLGGEERELRFDLNALVAAEEALGADLLNGLNMERMNFRQIRSLLWASLLHTDPNLTEIQVGSWVTAANMEQIGFELGQAFTSANDSGIEPSSNGNGAEKNG